MIREILDWLQLASQQDVPLEQFSSPGLALLAVFGLGLLFVAVPAGGSELFALAAGSVTPRGMAVPCSCCSPLGTSSASSSGSGLAGSVRVTNPKAQAWIAQAHQFTAQHPRLEEGMLLTSALASVDPSICSPWRLVWCGSRLE